MHSTRVIKNTIELLSQNFTYIGCSQLGRIQTGVVIFEEFDKPQFPAGVRANKKKARSLPREGGRENSADSVSEGCTYLNCGRSQWLVSARSSG
jgi:hypothetical protein